MLSTETIEILKIGVPALTAVVVPILTTCWLARRLARYQTRLSKELEHHKQQLQSEFQRTLYEFQTRYSLLHQKRAGAIERLFELLAKLQNDLQVWAYWDAIDYHETKEQFYAKTQQNYQNLIDFYNEKRIYFDEEIGAGVGRIVATTRSLLSGHDSTEYFTIYSPGRAEQMKNHARAFLDQDIHPVMNQLEYKFKQILSAEPANAEIERHASGPPK